MTKENELRAKEFLDCIGNGKSIYECERDNDLIDEEYNEDWREEPEEHFNCQDGGNKLSDYIK